ncbi:hypothetical protein BDV40DRAFT_251888 [Aspergillus tamarii]|uniref:Uncharacterized protein n=1 Tax=Aspergillus tamarii TaxID=41984 RepID=A0A5N6VF37_ASPTM|nr:hypothetical protein BDV40DRAFT_251888 [Aspergillus tamarii]
MPNNPHAHLSSHYVLLEEVPVTIAGKLFAIVFTNKKRNDPRAAKMSSSTSRALETPRS